MNNTQKRRAKTAAGMVLAAGLFPLSEMGTHVSISAENDAFERLKDLAGVCSDYTR
jgi:hypothetical protein